MEIYHCHEDGCNGKECFFADHPLDGVLDCPVCGKPVLFNVATECEICGNIFFSNKRHHLDERVWCPYCRDVRVVYKQGEPKNHGKGNPSPPVSGKDLSSGGAGGMNSTLALLFIVLVSFLIYGVVQLIYWFAHGINWLIQMFNLVFTQGGPILLENGIMLIALLALFVGVHTLIVRPVSQFMNLQKRSKDQGFFSTIKLKEYLGLPPSSPSYEILKPVLERSRNTIVIQQLIIAALLIGSAIGALCCYLSVRTLERATALLKDVVELGGITAVVFGIVFYALKFFIGLDRLLISKSSFFKGFIISAMFGFSTVVAMILIPILLPLPSPENQKVSEIAVGLVMNVVVDVFVTSFETIGSLCRGDEVFPLLQGLRKLWGQWRASLSKKSP